MIHRFKSFISSFFKKDDKLKEFNDLQQRTLELKNTKLSKEELKFERDCLIIDAAYIDKKYGIDHYYNDLIRDEKGKT